MSYTFLQLQNQLASMIGAELVTDLVESDQQHIKDVINQVYYECYTPMDGRRPQWSERYFAWSVPAPKTGTATVTEGSRTVTYDASLDLGAGFIGCTVALSQGKRSTDGSIYYHVANRVSDTEIELVEPYDGATGTSPITLYPDSYDLGVYAADIAEAPELVGHGVLSAMAGVETELKYRSYLKGDFNAQPGKGYGATVSINYSGMEHEAGTPLFYYVDTAALSATAPLTARFVTYPMPDGEYRIRLRANVVPALLSDDADTPILPLQAVTTVLLPLARARFATTSRRYNGDNRTMLERDAMKAEQRLKSFASPQKRKQNRMRLRSGY